MREGRETIRRYKHVDRIGTYRPDDLTKTHNKHINYHGQALDTSFIALALGYDLPLLEIVNSTITIHIEASFAPITTHPFSSSQITAT